MRRGPLSWYNVRRNFVSTQVESQNKSKGTCFKIRGRGLRGAGRFRGIMCAESRIRGDPFDTRELFPCGAGDLHARLLGRRPGRFSGGLEF